MHPTQQHRLYARHAAAADRGAWSVERDVRWDAVRPDLALTQPDVLAAIRDAALIESYHPIHLGQLLRCMQRDVDACVVFALELYEGFKHFHVLRTYLDAVRFAPAITDDDLLRIRVAAEREPPITEETLVEALVEFMLSEHLASYFFRRLGERAADPVLAELLALIAADEIRHAQSASDLLAARIAADPACIPRVLDAATHFHHFGERAVGDVPVAMPGDPLAIRTFAKRIERLCGVRLVDHLKTGIDEGVTAGSRAT